MNLLPAGGDAATRRRSYAPYLLGATLPVLAGALVFLGWSTGNARLVERRNQLGAVEAGIAALGPSQALRDETARVLSDRAAREAALAAALAKQQPWDVALGQISRVLPGDVWLTSLAAQSPTPAGAGATGAPPVAAPDGFTIQGYAFSNDSVARMLERLALVPSLSGVTLSSTGSSTIGSRPVVQFEISAALQAAPG